MDKGFKWFCIFGGLLILSPLVCSPIFKSMDGYTPEHTRAPGGGYVYDCDLEPSKCSGFENIGGGYSSGGSGPARN